MLTVRQMMSKELKKAFDDHQDPKDDELMDCDADSTVGGAILRLDAHAMAFCRVFDPVVTETEGVWEAVRHQARIYYFG